MDTHHGAGEVVARDNVLVGVGLGPGEGVADDCGGFDADEDFVGVGRLGDGDVGVEA